MRKSQIFLGNINRCTNYTYIGQVFEDKFSICGFGDSKYESEISSKSVPLLKLRNGNYVCIDSLNNLEAFIDLYKYILDVPFYKTNRTIILFSKPKRINDMFVDEKSLVPYYDSNLKDEKTTIKKVQKDLMLDRKLSRNKDADYGHDDVITQPCLCKTKRHM